MCVCVSFFLRPMIEMRKKCFQVIFAFLDACIPSAAERINFNQFGRVHLNDMRKLRVNICKASAKTAQIRVSVIFPSIYRQKFRSTLRRWNEVNFEWNFKSKNPFCNFLILLPTRKTNELNWNYMPSVPAYRHRVVFAVSLLMTDKININIWNASVEVED